MRDRLRAVFGPQIERAPLRGIHDDGDFVGLPHGLHVEAKSTKTLLIPQWAGRLETILPAGHQWVIAWHGDRRSLPVELAITPFAYVESMWERLFETYRNERTNQ